MWSQCLLSHHEETLKDEEEKSKLQSGLELLLRSVCVPGSYLDATLLLSEV
jgi:hypothetical protein